MSHNFPGNPWGDVHSEVTTDTAGLMSALYLMAFEQRTANLIAYLAHVGPGLSESIPTADISNIRREVHEQIAANLGLRRPQ